jgi:hypothetical protein
VNRRAFLQLLGAAPLAALIPWRPPTPVNLVVAMDWSQIPAPTLVGPGGWCDRCRRVHPARTQADVDALVADAARAIADRIDREAFARYSGASWQ